MEQTDDRPERIRFGSFELDPHTAELWRDGELVHLQEQAFEILRTLLERPGGLVTREELCRRLWPDGTFVDYDHSLNTAVMKLRQALGDSAEDPRFIETLPRRGYRFIAEVDRGQQTSSAAGSTPDHDAAKRRFLLRGTAIVVASMAVVLIAVLLMFPLDRQTEAGGESRASSIAVLPFVVEGAAGEDDQYLGDGLAETLINTLSRLPETKVIGRTSSFRYGGQNIDPTQVASDLDVEILLLGHVRQEGDNLEIHVELVRGEDGSAEWARTYRVGVGAIELMRHEMANDIARQMNVESGLGSASPQASEIDPEAYRSYLRGLALERRRTRESLRRAVSHFHDAIQREPAFAPAYAGLAKTYGIMVAYGALPPDEGQKLTYAAAERALELDPNLAEPYATLGASAYQYEWNYEKSAQYFRRAIALRPGYADAHYWYGHLLYILGRHEEAEEEILRSMELDPLGGAAPQGYCIFLVETGRFEEALEYYERQRSLQPIHDQRCFARPLQGLGRYEELIRAARADPDRLPLTARLADQLEHALEREGPRGYWKVLFEDELTRYRGERPSVIAPFYAARAGEIDEAFFHIDRMIDDRRPHLPGLMTGWWSEPLRDDPRYAEAMRRIGLDELRADLIQQ